MGTQENCPAGSNVLTIDGRAFDFFRMAHADELTCALRKMHDMAGNNQITVVYALAETVDDNGNPHHAVVRYGVPSDKEAFHTRLQGLANEIPAQTTTAAAPGSEGGVEPEVADAIEHLLGFRRCVTEGGLEGWPRENVQKLIDALGWTISAALARRSAPATGGAARRDREAVARLDSALGSIGFVDEPLAYHIKHGLAVKLASALNPAPQSHAASEGARYDDWREDPAADERWNAGLDYGMQQLCAWLGVDPGAVNWDAATETLDGDVRAVQGNILRKKFGDDFDFKAVVPVNADDPAAITPAGRGANTLDKPI